MPLLCRSVVAHHFDDYNLVRDSNSNINWGTYTVHYYYKINKASYFIPRFILNRVIYKVASLSGLTQRHRRR